MKICWRGRRKGCLPAGKASSYCITQAISSFSRCCHGERCWEGAFLSSRLLPGRETPGNSERRRSPTSLLHNSLAGEECREKKNPPNVFLELAILDDSGTRADKKLAAIPRPNLTQQYGRCGSAKPCENLRDS